MVVDTYMKMFQALLPKNIEEFAKKDKGTINEGIKVYVLAWIVGLIIGVLGLLLAITTAGPDMQALSQMIGMDVVGVLGVVVLIVTSIIWLVWGVASQYITLYVGGWCASSFFGGKGKFEQLFYVVMLFSGAVMIITALFGILDVLVPAVAVVTGIISPLLGLWTLYLLYLTIKTVYKVELGGGVVSTLAVLVAGIILAVIVGVILLTILGVGVLGGAAATGALGGM
ncbi:MAG: hypothetical protein GY852_11300 [bacterium]|nr:hypothetical protein [bacterium]